MDPADRVVRIRTTIRRDPNGEETHTTTIDYDPLAHAKWMLARLDPEHWGDRNTHDGQTENNTAEPPKIYLVFDDGDSDAKLRDKRASERNQLKE